MTSIPSLSARELLDCYRARRLSPSEVAEDLIRHIGRREPELCALYLFDPDAVRAAAAESTRRWARGEPGGPARRRAGHHQGEHRDGPGDPMPLGDGGRPPWRPPQPTLRPPRGCGRPAPPAGQDHDAGLRHAVVRPVELYKLARNPWDTRLTPGGSSAGAGAAGAAGYGPLHLGTDIGGSVRLPAGWCGLVGLKPSAGRVPIDPPFSAAWPGPMTRTAADAALMMSVLSLPNSRDGTSLPPHAIDWDDLAISIV